MRRVLIATPSYDGKLDAWYCDSLVRTIKQASSRNISIDPVYLSYDALIQRARNRLFKIAHTQNYDDIFFIDSDIEWNPDWVFSILERPEPIVGAALIKKSEKELYTVRMLSEKLSYSQDKRLIEVDGVGTGFLKISKFAIDKLWEVAEPYKYEDEDHRMVFSTEIKDGEFLGEDYYMCKKWQSLGYKTWIDPNYTCNHIGHKKYTGNIKEYLKNNGYV